MTTISLDALGLKHDTDKASSHHDYLRFYEQFLAPLRELPISILEIGVSNGASLSVWEDYFSLAKIVGIDITSTAKRFARGRVAIELVDQSNVEELTQLAMKYGPFDLVIEDGSHMWEHQITTLRTLFPFLKRDGLYIVEDLQTNYGNLQGEYRGIATSSCMEYLKRWVDLRVADEQLPIGEVEDAFLRTYGHAAHFLTFYRHACVIKKKYASAVREPAEGSPVVTRDTNILPVEVLAHLSNRGDVRGQDGYVNPTVAPCGFQGLSLRDPFNVLEYRVGWADLSWSEWCRAGEFCGTRGVSKTVTRIAVRVRDEARERFHLRLTCRFFGWSGVVATTNGSDCISPTGAALCGVQVDLASCGDPSQHA